jgi:hypothetical protein
MRNRPDRLMPRSGAWCVVGADGARGICDDRIES